MTVVGVVSPHPSPPQDAKRLPSKFPKKFDPSRDSSPLRKDFLAPTAPAFPSDSVPANQLFRVPLFRQDLLPAPDQRGEEGRKEVVIYSRLPSDEEGFQAPPGDKDSRSYTKTLKFIMNLLEQRALEEKQVTEQPPEVVTPFERDPHTIYTSDARTLRLTREEEEILRKMVPVTL